jgi:hypothetical protein
MRYVNQQLRLFDNNSIDGGRHYFIAAPLELTLPVAWPVKPTIPITPALERLSAASQTTHSETGADGQTRTTQVDWSVNASGILWTPTLPLKGQWYARPSVGGYWLDKPFKSRVIVSDRTGRLDFTGFEVGYSVAAGRQIRLWGSNSSVDIEGGYRWLDFRDVRQIPSGGFSPGPGLPPAQAGTLPGSINFSGAFFRVGLTWQHTLPQSTPTK